MSSFLQILPANLLYSLSTGTALILVASGLSLIFGMMGVVNFAHGTVFMLGAYVGFTVTRVTGNFWLALVAAPCFLFIIGFLMERFTIRPLYGHDILLQLLLTFGFSLVIAKAIELIWGADPLPDFTPTLLKGGVKIFGVDFPYVRLFGLALSTSIIVGIWLFLTRTKFGLIMRAAIHNTEMVDAFGINISKIFTLTFAAGSALAGLAGVIMGIMESAGPEMDIQKIIIAFVIVVIGGLGSFRGVVVVGILLALVEVFGVQLSSDLGIDRGIIYLVHSTGIPLQDNFSVAPYLKYMAMAAILLVKPEGLFKEV